MTHYVCPACGGVATVPGVCSTEGCSMQNQQLKECNCENGDHAEVKGQPQAAEQPQQ